MKLAGVILAAGKGKRFGSKNINKVTLQVAGRPIILYGVELLKKLSIEPIIVVVGFAKESVINALKGEKVSFAYQKNQLGTGNALSFALKKVPKEINNIIVLNGDDALFLSSKIVRNLIGTHLANKAALSLLTIEIDSPKGIGRVVRNKKGNVVAIVEEKDTSTKERTIREVNGLGYVFSIAFLKKYLPKVARSKVTGEYYLTSLVEIAAKNGEKIADFKTGRIPWRGINTEEDLKEAEKLLKLYK